MTRLKEKEIRQVFRAFSAAYRAMEGAEVGDAWERRVMARIRDLGPLTTRRGMVALFERYAWCLVPAAAAIVLVLGALVHQQMGFLADGEMARLLVEIPLEDAWFQVMGAS